MSTKKNNPHEHESPKKAVSPMENEKMKGGKSSGDAGRKESHKSGGENNNHSGNRDNR